MNLESAYFVVQILAGIAVVASLLYVGIQVRENTRATRMAAVQDLQALVGKVEELVIADGELADILFRGTRKEEVSGSDQLRLVMLYRLILRAWQTGHYLHRTGALDESVWMSQANLLSAVLQQDAGLRSHFEQERAALDPVFTDYVESTLRTKPLFSSIPENKREE